MALEVIQAIKETEARADEIKKQAAAESRELIKKAERENEEYFEQKTAEARQKASGIAADCEAEALREQQRMESDSEKKKEELRSKAALNMDAAVKFILGRLE